MCSLEKQHIPNQPVQPSTRGQTRPSLLNSFKCQQENWESNLGSNNPFPELRYV